jgi:hypothetical protein
MTVALLKLMKWAPFQRLRALPKSPGSDSVESLKSFFRITNPLATTQTAAKTMATKAHDETLRWGRFIFWTMKMKKNHANMKPTWANSISVCVPDMALDLLRTRS